MHCQNRRTAQSPGSEENHDQRGKNSLYAPGVEITETEALLRKRSKNDARDQIPGNHEKYINTHPPSASGYELGVSKHNRQNRYCTQTINVRAIPGMGNGVFAVARQTHIEWLRARHFIHFLSRPCDT